MFLSLCWPGKAWKIEEVVFLMLLLTNRESSSRMVNGGPSKPSFFFGNGLFRLKTVLDSGLDRKGIL